MTNRIFEVITTPYRNALGARKPMSVAANPSKNIDFARGVSVCVRNESAQVIANQRIDPQDFVARTCMQQQVQ